MGLRSTTMRPSQSGVPALYNIFVVNTDKGIDCVNGLEGVINYNIVVLFPRIINFEVVIKII